MLSPCGPFEVLPKFLQENFFRFQAGEPKSGGLSDKEAKILAKLNARKNKEAAKITPVETVEQPYAVVAHHQDNHSVSEEIVNTKKNKQKNSGDSAVLTGEEEAGIIVKRNKKKKDLSEESNNTLSENDGVDHAVESENLIIPIEDVKQKKKRAVDDISSLNLDQMPSAFSEPKKKKKRKNKEAPTSDNVDEKLINGTEDSTENQEEPVVEQVDETPAEEEPQGAGFTVLEEVKTNKQQKVFRILPNWLAKPAVISSELSSSKTPIKEVKGLDNFLLEALRRNKVKHLFPGK